MAEDFKKVKIKDLPNTDVVSDSDLFINTDSLETHNITADTIAKYVSENKHISDNYINKNQIGVANGIAPLNGNKKINGSYIIYGTTSNTAYSGLAGKTLETNLDNHLLDENPHGLGNVDNTSDMDKPVSTAQQTAIDDALNQSKDYTDARFDAIVGEGASETLDTIGEISKEIEEHQTVIDAINAAIGNKANKSDFETHVNNTENPHRVTKDQLGLGNVENKSSETIRGELTKENIINALGYEPDTTTDNVITYALSKEGSSITLTGSDGSTTSVTDSDTNTVYTHPITSGNKHIPSGGSSGQILRWSADGTAVWDADNNTTIAYGTCSTAAATAAKVITITSNTNWELKVGAIVVVKFTITNTASSVTLNVNSTGAKSIWYGTGVYTGNSNLVCGYANRYQTYMYDGTYWVWISSGSDANTTYSNATLGQGYGTCATAEATTAKVVTLSSYALVVGGIVAVKFTYAVPASSTLNVNSKGAKAIYYRGAAITANVIKAGDIATFIYDGSQYHLLTVDRQNSNGGGEIISTTEPSGQSEGDYWLLEY